MELGKNILSYLGKGVGIIAHEGKKSLRSDNEGEREEDEANFLRAP